MRFSLGMLVWGALVMWALAMFIVNATGLVMGVEGYLWYTPLIFLALMAFFGVGYTMTKDGQLK